MMNICSHVLFTAVAATALHKWAEIILIPESQTECYGANFHTRVSAHLGILKDFYVFLMQYKNKFKEKSAMQHNIKKISLKGKHSFKCDQPICTISDYEWKIK